MTVCARALAAALVTLGAPAEAQHRIRVDLPAGSLAQQVLALGSRGRVNIIVRDRVLWNRPVPALRGYLSADLAFRRIAAAANATIVILEPGSYELVPRRARPPRPAPPRPRRRPTPPPSAASPDIVVTASKRGVSRRDFPGQASWVTGDELELDGSGGTSRLVDRLTSVASTYLGPGRNKLFIRGIADSSFTGATQPTVGQYFGDLRLNYTGPDPDLRLIDLAGVEVLEGPQGTLYGAGSLGGLIRLIPNMPQLGRFGGSVGLGGSVTQHGGPGTDAQMVLNVPIASDRVAMRIAAFAESAGGYIDKPLLEERDANRTRMFGGRGTIRFRMGDGWIADVTGMGQRIRNADSQYIDAEGERLSRASSIAEPSAADFAQAQIAVSGSLGSVGVQSTIGITANDVAENYDASGSEGPPRLFAQINRTRMVASETRAWRQGERGAGWVIGLSSIRNLARSDRLFGTPHALASTIGADNHANELTLYGEASRRLLPNLLATGGLRVGHIALSGSSRGQSEPDDPTKPAAVIDDSVNVSRLDGAQTIVLPSASLLVDLTSSARGFLRYQPGFRPGGVAVVDDRLQRFRRDRVDTFETGIRTTPSGRLKTDFTVTLAHTTWRDIQADFLDGRGLPGTANIGKGNILTFEATSSIRPTRNLLFTAAVSYNESGIDAGYRYRRPPNRSGESGTEPSDLYVQLQRIPNVAPLTARLGGVFERDIGGSHALRIDGWVRYVGPSSLGIGPILGQPQGDYLDSALTARLSRGRFGLTLSATNLADARGNRFALGTPVATGRLQATPLRPRTLRMGLDATF